jgi:purine-cytosine permease-like protein
MTGLISLFSVGFLSFALPIFMVVLFIGFFFLRKFFSWIDGKPGPTDRVIPKATFIAVACFFVGSMAQPFWSLSLECHAAKQPIPQCVHKYAPLLIKS